MTLNMLLCRELVFASFCRSIPTSPRTKRLCRLRALQIAVNDINKFAFVVEGAESISRMISRYAIFEDICLLRKSATVTELEKALTRLYASIILYFLKVKIFFEQNTASEFHQIPTSIEGLNGFYYAY